MHLPRSFAVWFACCCTTVVCAQSYSEIDTVNIGEANAEQLGVPPWMLFVVDPTQPPPPAAHKMAAHPNTFIGSFVLDLRIATDIPTWRYYFWMDATRVFMRMGGSADGGEVTMLVDMADSTFVLASGVPQESGKYMIGNIDSIPVPMPEEPLPMHMADNVGGYPCIAYYNVVQEDTAICWTTTAIPNAFLDAWHWAPMDADYALAVFRLMKNWGAGMPIRLVGKGGLSVEVRDVRRGPQGLPQMDLTGYWVRDRRLPEDHGPLLPWR
jgi:hypothetical protein